MNIVLPILQAVACAYMAIMSIMVLNRMTHRTRHMIRLAYLLILAGAGCGVLYCFEASTMQVLLALGVSVLLEANERPSIPRAKATS